jgi:hypothetical protein
MKDRKTGELEKIWRSLGITETLKASDWCFFRVRPDNFPIRRLIALSYVISRYHKSGLLRGILKLIKEAPQETEHRWLENGLIIAGQGYWGNHFDFGIAMQRTSALLGREKASEVVINAILPFVSAWGEAAAGPGLQRKADEIYHRYPKPGDNELTRYMRQQLRLKPDAHLSACQQQGLIHIFKTCCRHKACADCPVAFNRG